MFVLYRALNPDVHPTYRAYFIDKTTTCLDKDIPETYSLGETVSFLPDGRREAAAIRVCGWSNPVGNGTHSIGESSRLRVRLDGEPRELELTLKLTSTKPQTVQVSANGAPVGQMSLPGSDAGFEGSFRIREEVVGPRTSLDVELSYPDAIPPGPRASEIYKRAVRLLSFRLSPA